MTKLVLIKHSLPTIDPNKPAAMAYCAQAFSDETRHNLVGLWSAAELGPIDDGIACLIPDLRQVDVSIIYRHQPTAVIVTDCICTWIIIRDCSAHSLQWLSPGQPGDQGPTNPALHRQRPMHDEGRKDQHVSLAESDPVAGPLTIEDLDPAAVISPGGQLDDHR